MFTGICSGKGQSDHPSEKVAIPLCLELVYIVAVPAALASLGALVSILNRIRKSATGRGNYQRLEQDEDIDEEKGRTQRTATAICSLERCSSSKVIASFLVNIMVACLSVVLVVLVTLDGRVPSSFPRETMIWTYSLFSFAWLIASADLFSGSTRWFWFPANIVIAAIRIHGLSVRLASPQDENRDIDGMPPLIVMGMAIAVHAAALVASMFLLCCHPVVVAIKLERGVDDEPSGRTDAMMPSQPQREIRSSMSSSKKEALRSVVANDAHEDGGKMARIGKGRDINDDDFNKDYGRSGRADRKMGGAKGRGGEDSASVFSVIMFCWIYPTLNKAYQKGRIWAADLPQRSECDDSKRVHQEFQRIWRLEVSRAEEEERDPSLVNTLYLLVKGRFWGSAALQLASLAANLTVPIIFNKLLENLQRQQTSSSSFWNYHLAFGFFAASIVSSLCLHSMWMVSTRGVFHTRLALSAAVMHKLCHVRPSERRTLSFGKLTSFLSLDAARIAESYLIASFHWNSWSAAIQFMVSVYFLFSLLGPSGLVGAMLVIVLVPVGYCLAKRQGTLTKGIMHQRDLRTGLLGQFLNAVLVSKLLRLEGWIQRRSSEIREEELTLQWYKIVLNMFNYLVSQAGPIMTIVLAFVSYSLTTDRPLSPATAFTAIIWFDRLKTSLTGLAWLVRGSIDASISLSRLKDFLLLPEAESSSSLLPQKESAPPRELPHNPTATTHEVSTTSGASGAHDNKALLTLGFEMCSLSWNRPDSSLLGRKNSEKREGEGKQTRRENEDIADNEDGYGDDGGDGGREGKVLVGRPSSMPATLKRLNFCIRSGELVLVVGPVGAGKSSMLHALMGDMTTVSGRRYCYVGGSNSSMRDGDRRPPKITIVGQKPWLEDRSVRDNVTRFYRRETNCGTLHLESKKRRRSKGARRGNSESRVEELKDSRRRGPQSNQTASALSYSSSSSSSSYFPCIDDEQRYLLALQSCALIKDIKALPHRDRTVVGEGGRRLSGGQRQRVALARAVYSDSDLYLLDDVLSAVDAKVARTIFHECVAGVLRGKTRVVVTHQLQFARSPFVDKVLVLAQDGSCVAFGPYDTDMERAITRVMATSSTTSAAPITPTKKRESRETPAGTNKGGGESKKMISLQNAKEGGGGEEERKGHQAGFQDGSSRPSTLSYNNITLRHSLEEISGEEFTQNSPDPSMGCGDKREQLQVEGDDDSSGVLRLSHVAFYLRGLGVGVTCVSLLCQALAQACTVMTTVWLSIWTSKNTTKLIYVFVFAALAVAGMIMQLLLGLSLGLGSIKASRQIHDKMLSSVLAAPLSFFDSHPVGKSLNRFTADIAKVDETLAGVMFNTLNSIFSFVGVVVVIGFSVPYALLLVFPLGIPYYVVAERYRWGSRDLRRLDARLRAPVLSFFGEVVQGMCVIQAHRATAIFETEFLSHLNMNARSFIAFWAANQWVTCAMETMGAVFVLFASVLVVYESSTGALSPAAAALVLTYALQLPGAINAFIRQYANAEMEFVAIERIAEYSEIEPEERGGEGNEKPKSTMESMLRQPLLEGAASSSAAPHSSFFGDDNNTRTSLPPRRRPWVPPPHPPSRNNNNNNNNNNNLLSEGALHHHQHIYSINSSPIAAVISSLNDDKARDRGYNNDDNNEGEEDLATDVAAAMSISFESVHLRYQKQRPSSESKKTAMNGDPGQRAGDDRETEVDGAPSRGTPSHSSNYYHYALKGLSFRVKAGHKIAIVGRTGAGKSSLCLAIARAYGLCSGRILLDGRDIKTISLRQLRDSITYIPQTPALFQGTILENFQLGEEGKRVGARGKRHGAKQDMRGRTGNATAAAEENVWALLERVGVADAVRSLPGGGGLHTQISEGGSNLSEGEKQLICLARALIDPTGLLICDEPTANVDFATDLQIHKVLFSLRRTVLVICHRLEHIERFDRVLVMEKGRVGEYGAPADLLKKDQGLLTGLVSEWRRSSNRSSEALEEKE